jgi:hypothetical protein
MPVSGHPCVAGGVLDASQQCQTALANAKAEWPAAALALTGVTLGNGSWIVPDPDGFHFDMVTVLVKSTPYHTAPIATNGTTTGSHVAPFALVQDVLALSIIGSGSGSINTSGYSCGANIGWSGYVYWNMWYNTHLEMDVSGNLNFCNSAYTSTLTPIEYGAGTWTFTSGTIGNGTTQTNPWINWYGSSILACNCSDTVLERYYMDAWGNWNWAVWN